MGAHTATVTSRAAVAGNPSDGFGGAVCSAIVPFFAATALVGAGDRDGEIELVAATRSRFERSVGAIAGDTAVTVDTTIPRSVGLAGSSAIVIATLRALDQQAGTALSSRDIARLAHRIERDDLGIAGGWQDQIIQSNGATGLMEFGSEPSLRALAIPDPPIPVYLAWSETAAEASGHSHRSLRAQRDAADPVWEQLAQRARQAADAIEARDVHELKVAIDATYDIRARMMDIAPQQQAMIDAARSVGASANFAGSGGAIFGVLPKDGSSFLDHMHNAGYSCETWSLT